VFGGKLLGEVTRKTPELLFKMERNRKKKSGVRQKVMGEVTRIRLSVLPLSFSKGLGEVLSREGSRKKRKL